MAGSLPAMIKFYEEHKDDDRFEFIAFHDGTVKTLEEMDAKLKEKGIPEEHWGGRALPFPILLDSTGETIKKLGINSFPTTIAINPQGELVGEMHLDAFAKLLTEGEPERKQRDR